MKFFKNLKYNIIMLFRVRVNRKIGSAGNGRHTPVAIFVGLLNRVLLMCVSVEVVIMNVRVSGEPLLLALHFI